MNSRERVQTALNHQEPDRVPFDLGGTPMSGMHKVAYKNLRAHLGLPEVEIRVVDSIQQLAAIDEDVADILKVDIYNVAPRSSAKYNLEYRDEGELGDLDAHVEGQERQGNLVLRQTCLTQCTREAETVK